MNFYVDPFLSVLCDEFKFGEIYLDLLCNTCYYGAGNEYNRKEGKPDARFLDVYPRLGPLIQNFFCNSVNGFIRECIELLTFLQSFSHIPQTYYRTRHKTVQLTADDYSEMIASWEELWGSDESMDYEGHMDSNVIAAIIHNGEQRLNYGKDQDAGDFHVGRRYYSERFYSNLLTHIKQCVIPGNFHPDFVAQNVKLFNNGERRIELAYSVLAVLPREQYAGRSVEIIGNRRKTLLELYAKLGNAGTEHKMIVNQILVLSGFHPQIFTNLFKQSNDGRNGPTRIREFIFEQFEDKCMHSKLLHPDMMFPDYKMPEYIYNLLVNKLLVTKSETIKPAKEGELEQMIPMYEDYTKLPIIQRQAQVGMVESFMSSLTSPIFIILVLVILCVIFFV